MRKRRDYRPYSYDYDMMPLKTRYQVLLEKMQNIDIDTSKINVTAKINYDDLNDMIGKAIKDNPLDSEALTSLRHLIVKSKCEVIENMSSNCCDNNACCTGSSIPTDQLATKVDVENAVSQIIANTDAKASEIPTKVKEELAPDFKEITNNVDAKSNEIITEVQVVKTELDNKLDKDVFKEEANNINTKLDDIDTEVKKKLDSDIYEAGVALINEKFTTIEQKIDDVDTKVQTLGEALVNDWGERLVNV